MLGDICGGDTVSNSQRRCCRFYGAQNQSRIKRSADGAGATQGIGATAAHGRQFALDANGAWDIATAQRMLDGLAELPIQALEEPLRQPDVAQFAALQQRVHFPLAQDESLHIPVAQFPRRIVLKPVALAGRAARWRWRSRRRSGW